MNAAGGSFELAAVIATKSRPEPLSRTLESLAKQSIQPARVIVVDASPDTATRDLCERGFAMLRSQLQWTRAIESGAARQRNQGVAIITEPFVWFLDDDIVLEPDCLGQIWKTLKANPELAGVNAFITNQSYHPPGAITRQLLRLMDGDSRETYAGRVVGPAINLLPEDRPGLPEVVPVEWLNTTCTVYRREALPSPPFDPFFEGYSLMEDLALSLTVAKRGWKLANVRTARIFHDSQPGEHKDDVAALSAMELRNRLYVMEELLEQRKLSDYLRLLIWESFGVASGIVHKDGLRKLLPTLAGKVRALRDRLKRPGGNPAQ